MEWLPPVALILGIGLIAALVAGRQFAPPVGGGLGAVVGVAMAVRETMETRVEERSDRFCPPRGRSSFGARFRHDNRIAGIFGLAFLCGLSAALWQLLLLAQAN